jgi:hypothetical protein
MYLVRLGYDNIPSLDGIDLILDGKGNVALKIYVHLTGAVNVIVVM